MSNRTEPKTPPRPDLQDLRATNLTPKDIWCTPTSINKKLNKMNKKRQNDHELLTPENTPQKSYQLEDAVIARGNGNCISPISDAKGTSPSSNGRKAVITQTSPQPIHIFKPHEGSARESRFEPATPSNNLITPQKVQEWYGKSRNNWFDDDVEDDGEEHSDPERFISCTDSTIFKFKEDNPFVERRQTKPISLNPFVSNGWPPIDYATHMELVNHKTGLRTIKELPAHLKRIRPRKLTFDDLKPNPNENSVLSSTTSKPSNSKVSKSARVSAPSNQLSSMNGQTEINKKFLSKNLRGFNLKSKNSLDFNIYKDGTK